MYCHLSYLSVLVKLAVGVSGPLIRLVVYNVVAQGFSNQHVLMPLLPSVEPGYLRMDVLGPVLALRPVIGHVAMEVH